MIDFSNMHSIVTPKGEVYSIANNKEILWQKSKLPLAYQEVEYLQSTGTQYIDTGIVPAYGCVVKARTEFVVNPAGTSAEQINGVSYSGRCGWGYARSVTNKNFYIGINAININTGVPLDDLPHTFVISLDGNWSIDDHAGYSDCGTNTPNGGLRLFARNNGGGINTPCKEKFYFFKVYENGVLICDFVPCRRKNDGTLGMYDIVTGKFFTNKGTGEFLHG